MEARRRVEFTGGCRAVTTIDQMDSAYYKAGEDPFVAASIVGLTHSPSHRLQLVPQPPTTIGSFAVQRIWWKE
jgi:hypothetical protein